MTGTADFSLRMSTPDTAPDALILTASGNLDIDSAGVLRAALDQLPVRWAKRVILDLSGLAFCDSVGLSALVDAHRGHSRRGGYFRLAAPTPFLSRVLEIVGLIGQLAVYDSVADALADRPPGGHPPPVRARPAR